METASRFESILKHWRLDTIASWRAIQDKVFRITLVDGRQLVLKDLGLQNERTIQRLQFEYDVLRHVVQTGLPAAVPLLSDDGRPYVVDVDRVFRLSNWLRNEPAEVNTGEERRRLFRNYGAAIARFHRALTSYTDPEILSRTWQTDLQTRVIDEAVPVILAHLDQSRLDSFKATLAGVESEMAMAFADLPRQLVIWDCHPGNVAVDGYDVSGFIDCDHLSIAPRIFDLADFLVHLIKWDIGDSQKELDWLADFPQLISGYDSVTPLSERERAGLFYAMVGIVLIFMDFFLQSSQFELTKTELDTIDWLVFHRRAIVARIETSQ